MRGSVDLAAPVTLFSPVFISSFVNELYIPEVRWSLSGSPVALVPRAVIKHRFLVEYAVRAGADGCHKRGALGARVARHRPSLVLVSNYLPEALLWRRLNIFLAFPLAVFALAPFRRLVRVDNLPSFSRPRLGLPPRSTIVRLWPFRQRTLRRIAGIGGRALKGAGERIGSIARAARGCGIDSLTNAPLGGRRAGVALRLVVPPLAALALPPPPFEAGSAGAAVPGANRSVRVQGRRVAALRKGVRGRGRLGGGLG